MSIRPWQWKKYKSGTISLCMIMKNEAKRLGRCLESVKDLVSEIIIVDTGSTDSSRSIAESYGASVVLHPWEDDFSASRNYGIRMATCDWILILDPDEVISKKDFPVIREYVTDDRFSAYHLTTRNYTGGTMQQGFRPNLKDYIEGKDWPGFVPSTKTRLFRNHLGIHFRGVWHELVDWYIEAHNIPHAIVPTPIHHYPGEITQKSYKEKALFYNRLGLKKVREWPTNSQAWHELFVSFMILKEYRKAAYCAARSLRNAPPNAGRFFSQARALNEIEAKEIGKFAFEKGICLLYPNLTHVEQGKKGIEDLIL